MKRVSGHWRALTDRIDPGIFWLLVWLPAPLVHILHDQRLTVVLALVFWFSAVLLAPGKTYGCRLMRMAFGFWLFWALAAALLTWLSPAAAGPPLASLALWLALGLNLMLGKSALSLSLRAGEFLRPLLGPRRSRKLALLLALMLRLLPQFLETAQVVRRAVLSRAGGLSFKDRLMLWGRALIRSSLGQTEELSRALLKRWPWD